MDGWKVVVCLFIFTLTIIMQLTTNVHTASEYRKTLTQLAEDHELQPDHNEENGENGWVFCVRCVHNGYDERWMMLDEW